MQSIIKNKTKTEIRKYRNTEMQSKKKHNHEHKTEILKYRNTQIQKYKVRKQKQPKRKHT